MRRKKACLVIDLRDGENVPHVPEMVAVKACKPDGATDAVVGLTLSVVLVPA